MSFDYRVVLSDPAERGRRDQVLFADMKQALAEWSKYIDGAGTLVVDLQIGSTAENRAAGGPTELYLAGTQDGTYVYGSSALYELTTGTHLPGTESDITVTVTPADERHYDLARVLHDTSRIPPNKENPVSIFMHELEHGFGQTGLIDQSGERSSPDQESTFDRFVVQTPDGYAYFTGPNAEAAYGGPVPLTTDSRSGENYYHFGDTISDFRRSPQTVEDPLTLDLMNGIAFFAGHDYLISSLDVGVLADLGYAVHDPGHPVPTLGRSHQAHP